MPPFLLLLSMAFTRCLLQSWHLVIFSGYHWLHGMHFHVVSSGPQLWVLTPPPGFGAGTAAVHILAMCPVLSQMVHTRSLCLHSALTCPPFPQHWHTVFVVVDADVLLLLRLAWPFLHCVARWPFVLHLWPVLSR